MQQKIWLYCSKKVPTNLATKDVKLKKIYAHKRKPSSKLLHIIDKKMKNTIILQGDMKDKHDSVIYKSRISIESGIQKITNSKFFQ